MNQFIIALLLSTSFLAYSMEDKKDGYESPSEVDITWQKLDQLNVDPRLKLARIKKEFEELKKLNATTGKELSSVIGELRQLSLEAQSMGNQKLAHAIGQTINRIKSPMKPGFRNYTRVRRLEKQVKEI